ncbi:Protein max [Trichinella sp. T8]|nr:Protein max [Trichinella sp. T8]
MNDIFQNTNHFCITKVLMIHCYKYFCNECYVSVESLRESSTSACLIEKLASFSGEHNSSEMKYPHQSNRSSSSKSCRIDVEEGNCSLDSSNSTNNDAENSATRRALHNALERSRRNQIKEAFTLLREALPMKLDSKSSRATILNCAAAYVMSLQSRIQSHQKEIEECNRAIKELEAEILEQSINTSNIQ